VQEKKEEDDDHNPFEDQEQKGYNLNLNDEVPVGERKRLWGLHRGSTTATE